MAFKASFKFSDSREFDVLNWRVKFNRDVDPKGRPASDIYGGTIYVEVESTGSVVILGGLSLVNSLHAYTFASLKRKKLISTTPLNDALNA
ncbi:type VI secretion system tube protein TssD, partial [Bacteroides sp. HPS0048]|uniref:type VI secretion system tube protein TssD n=1 Tax=Bacteroides sp. HPS0048 TaxID=1078089 RepID=UPI003568CA09